MKISQLIVAIGTSWVSVHGTITKWVTRDESVRRSEVRLDELERP
jgi:hypothetical protein